MAQDSQLIYGLHPVMEAFESGKTIDKIIIKKDLRGESCSSLLSLARERGVPAQRVPIERLNRYTRKNHQGVIALLAAVDYQRVDQLLPMLYDEGINPFFVVLDGVTDVRNFGAVARTCECAGVSAIVIPQSGSVSVNADAVKTSAGALNHLPVCREKNLLEAVRYLKNSGCRIIGTTDKTDTIYLKEDYTCPVAIVLGSEDTGMSPTLMKECDALVAIPEFGAIKSLNVSVAAGIMIYEAVRQRLIDNQSISAE